MFLVAIYIPQGMAQGFKEPLEHRTVLHPIDSNIYADYIVYEIEIKGNDANHVEDRAWLQTIYGDVTSSGKPWLLSNRKVSLMRPPYDTLSYYGDISWYKSSFNLPPNFPLGRSYVKLRITADLDMSGIALGDSLDIQIKLAMGLDGFEPSYYDPLKQTLVYGQKPGSTGINNPKSNLTIYPNPFVDQINLLNFNEKEMITITNSIGQIVHTGTSKIISSIFH